jgi:hypothetical protein
MINPYQREQLQSYPDSPNRPPRCDVPAAPRGLDIHTPPPPSPVLPLRVDRAAAEEAPPLHGELSSPARPCSPVHEALAHPASWTGSRWARCAIASAAP